MYGFRDRHKMKEGSEDDGLQSVSVSPFPMLDKVDSPRRKDFGSVPLPEAGRENGSYD